MGWFGYGLYDGDETQTRHIDFIKWSGSKLNDDLTENVLLVGKTSLTSEMRSNLQKNIRLVLKKMPKIKKSDLTKQFYFRDERDAIDWQMLLLLFLDNKINPPALVKQNAILATEYLIMYCSDDFDDSQKRKQVLRSLLRKISR